MSSASKPIGMQLWRLVKEFRLQNNIIIIIIISIIIIYLFIYQKYNSKCKLSNTAKISPYSGEATLPSKLHIVTLDNVNATLKATGNTSQLEKK